MTATRKKVAIIGGGITGLAAAFYLHRDENDTVDFTLFEQSTRLGGKIQTVYRNGFVVERGPDSFVARKRSASKLVTDIGLEANLVRNHAGQAYVLNNDSLYPIPGGSMMGIPTEVTPFVKTNLFSTLGKVRAAYDLILPRQSKENEDQSLGHFFRRRLGNEVVENLIEPLLSGIYSSDIDRLSLMATFPQFYEVEREYRSLMLGMKKTIPHPKKRSKDEKKPSAFLTLSNGLESLVKKIEELLPPESIQKNRGVEKIIKQKDRYDVYVANGEKQTFDAVIITSPHAVIKQILRHYTISDMLKNYSSTSVANVAMAFDADKVKLSQNGTGFVVSRNANYTITACTWTHHKWPHTTPKGKVLLRAYVGRPGQSEIVEASDEDIIEVVLRDLNKVMFIEGSPDFHVVTRWREAMPQYTVGHKFRTEALKSQVQAELPGVFLAGSSFEGVGIPDCIDQGIETLNQTLTFLNIKKA